MENPNRENVYERQKERRKNIKKNNKNYIKFFSLYFLFCVCKEEWLCSGWMDNGVWWGNGSGEAIASNG